MPECNAFVSEYKFISKHLRNFVKLFANGKQIEVTALWDTGATNSHVSHEVVNVLQLVPTGFSRQHTPSGTGDCKTYIINSVLLPNNVSIPDVNVAESEIGAQGIGLLVGMDIISMGDFAVSNYNGETVFTFRTPSQKRTDYVAQVRLQNKVGAKHGKGTRKKK